MKSQNTPYASLIICTRPNINFLITNITKYILIALDTQVNIVQRHHIGLGRYGVLHSPPLRNIHPRMLTMSLQLQQMHLYISIRRHWRLILIDTYLLLVHFRMLNFSFCMKQIWVRRFHHFFSSTSHAIYSTCWFLQRTLMEVTSLFLNLLTCRSRITIGISMGTIWNETLMHFRQFAHPFFRNPLTLFIGDAFRST